MSHPHTVLLGIDIGGSFTDIVASNLQTGEISYAKTPTYSQDLVRSLREAIAAISVPVGEIGVIRHGTTVVINAILTRSGKRTALVTTKGFRDVLEIGRTNWPEPYNLFFNRMEPLVPRELRFEIDERMSASGEEISPVREGDMSELVAKIQDAKVEAVGVCLLHSYVDDTHEKLIGEALADAFPDAYISLSHELSREFREFERTSTVVTNAYVGGVVDGYLGELESYLESEGFSGRLYMMESNGGVTTAESARRRPVALVESGPAAGVMATAEISKLRGIDNAIAFDMGGTTAKACLVEGGVPLFTAEYFVPSYEQGFPLRVAALDILEVGTGGGSIARVDSVGMLTVGPESAGAVPGPACFGNGGEPTVTDANLVLGRLSPSAFLHGETALDVEAARSALAPLADRLGSDIITAAAGIIRLANVNMAAAIRRISLDRGRDPRDFQLFSYGGGGPLHGTEIARELSIPRLVIPILPGIFSALGMLLADLRQDFTQTYMRDLAALGPHELRDEFAALESSARSWENDIGSDAQGRRSVRYVDARYKGQEFTIMVKVPEEWDASLAERLRAAFEQEYQLRYGHSFPSLPLEIVGLRSIDYVSLPKPLVSALTDSTRQGTGAELGSRSVYFGSAGFLETPVVIRSDLEIGAHFEGPLVVEEYGSTTILGPRDTMVVDPMGQLVIDIAKESA